MVGALDPYRIADKLNDALLDVIVTRLEARGKHRFFQNVLRDFTWTRWKSTRQIPCSIWDAGQGSRQAPLPGGPFLRQGHRNGP